MDLMGFLLRLFGTPTPGRGLLGLPGAPTPPGSNPAPVVPPTVSPIVPPQPDATVPLPQPNPMRIGRQTY